ncbi:metallophosphoesterase [Clostridium sp. DJ247]|uniref:metallophosphoesterase n=1 Tax=Clostridium sp. DJ247 TaxID=2726188 RepID=UPI001624FE31|nr:metallophosphoesterase [Clostridium sp. DJ247]MBC2582727.1 metallophosphoesterase [Clostridium sp. DJ247]
MLIGVISDTHRYTWIIKDIIENLKSCDMIIHLGDNVQDVDEILKYYKGPIVNVKGNCDFAVDVPSERTENIEGKKFLITHGHIFDVKYDLSRLRYRALEIEADIVLFGHTHVSKISFEDGIWFVNPGSPILSRDGFNSVATIEIVDGKVNPSIKGVR